MQEFSIRICGEAGQGAQSIGIALAKAFKNSGRHVFAHQDFMSRIRGGNNFFQLRVSDVPVFCPRRLARVIITLDKVSAAIHASSLEKGGVLVADRAKFALGQDGTDFFDVPLYEIAARFGDELYVNAAASGVIAYLCGLDPDAVAVVFAKTFAAKGDEVVVKNRDAIAAGYAYADEHAGTPQAGRFAAASKRYLMNGNEAIAFGAVRAGCRFYTAYPMSPSTGIMNTVAQYASAAGIVVEQAEDEIAAVNMAIGASAMGARAMTSTSGGGFMLMMEGISLAGMLETPLVVADVQRPAPATGFPTRTEQADLEFLLSAGHGEFARLIYAPGMPREAFDLTLKAFDLAEKYQIPAIVMSDQHLADSYVDVATLDHQAPLPPRHRITREDSAKVAGYKRYALTDSVVSPLAVPGWIPEAIYHDSDEHTEEGHITEDAAVRVKMVEKRLYKKMALLEKEIVAPTVFGPVDAETTIIGFGSTYGILRELAEWQSEKKIRTIHLGQVWPFPSAALHALLAGAKRIMTLENNAGAQLARLLRRETGITVTSSVLKFDGRPFSLEDALEKITEQGV